MPPAALPAQEQASQRQPAAGASGASGTSGTSGASGAAGPRSAPRQDGHTNVGQSGEPVTGRRSPAGSSDTEQQVATPPKHHRDADRAQGRRVQLPAHPGGRRDGAELGRRRQLGEGKAQSLDARPLRGRLVPSVLPMIVDHLAGAATHVADPDRAHRTSRSDRRTLSKITRDAE